MYINRKLTEIITEISRQYPVIFLTGARQVGKTTLLQHIFKDYEYISFDLPSIAEQAETNPQLFFSRHRENILLDEIQYVPSIFRYLKHEVDTNPGKGRFILTGSQNFLLMKNITESLAGRCAILHLLPLSLNEVRESERHSSASDMDFIIRGGYPRLWAEPETNREIFFSSYLATYIERDVRNILNIEKVREFERFVRALATRCAQLLSYSDIARDVGVAVSTIKDWINVLWASNQIFFIEPYHRNLGKRLIKSPKVYLSDTGILCFLLNIHNLEDLMHSPHIGQVWENFVVNQIIAQFRFQGITPPVYFWRTRDGAEIDILIEKAGKLTALEIKFSEHILSRDAVSLTKFIHSVAKENINSAAVICRTSHEYLLDNMVRIVNIDAIQDIVK